VFARPNNRGTLALVTDRRGYEVLAANLHRLAFEQGLTLQAIAQAAGIPLERLQAILTGEFDPEIELVNRIGQAVGVTASELIADHEPD
jgi:transcriptional regulator with XRE-family HTH domain